MTQSPGQQMTFVAAELLGSAPIGFGLFRAWQTGSDLRILSGLTHTNYLQLSLDPKDMLRVATGGEGRPSCDVPR